MTFCLGITVKEGLLGIGDTRITSGNEVITARKINTYSIGSGPLFIMTSGLRSVRDKTLTYFEEEQEAGRYDQCNRLYKVVNEFSAKIKQVAREDKQALNDSGLGFDIHALVGGQLQDDKSHKLYLVYPQGNWVEITKNTPYYIIGERGYGKPVLDRTLVYTDPLLFALKVGCLAFDSTRISATGVDFPIDVLLYYSRTKELVEHRYEYTDFQDISNWWQEHLRASVNELPSEWMENIASKLEKVNSKKRSNDAL
jgi:putative proteasome-type protease